MVKKRKKIKSRRRINKVKKVTFIDYIKNIFNNKGFTLIEVLATIFVVSLVFSVGFSFVTRTINTSKSKSTEISLANVRSAAELYVKEYSNDVPWRKEQKENGLDTGNYTTCILVSDLVDTGFLTEDKAKGLKANESILLTKNRNGTVIKETLDSDGVCQYSGIKIPTSKEYCNTVSFIGGNISIFSPDNLSHSLLKKELNGVRFSVNGGIVNAGDYEVIAHLECDSNDEKCKQEKVLEWKDGSTEDKKFVCTVDKAVPNFTMYPTGIAASQIGIGKSTDVTLSSTGVKGLPLKGTLNVSNSSSDYVSTKLSSNVINGSVNLQIGFLASKGSNTYIRVTFTPDDIRNYKDVTLTYTIGDVKRKKVTKPTTDMCTKPGYNGTNQLLVHLPSSDSGYSLFDVYGLNAGEYIVTAKLNYGYVWNDDTVVDQKIKCIIRKSYEIKFNGNGSTSGAMGNQVCNYNQDCTLNASAFLRTGYTFGGWSKSTNGSKIYNDKQKVRDIGDTILYAVWNPGIYTVSLNKQGGSGGTDTIYEKYNTGWYSNATATKSISSVTVPTRTGYTFGGYYTNTNGGGVQIITNSGAIVNGKTSQFTSTVTLYAKWTANTFTVAYNGNGSTGGSTANHNCTYGGACKLAGNGFSRTGYTFTGWKKGNGGNTLAVGASIANVVTGGTVTYYAQWKANTFTVSYNGNGATGGSTASHNCSYGGTCKLAGNGFTRTGYTFAGWKKSNSGNTLGAGASIANAATSGTVTYYAQWNANTFTIAYNGNGSTGGSTASHNCSYGGTCKLAGNGFTRTGYTFTGWKKGNTGNALAAGASIANAATSGTVTYYAQWAANTFTVSYSGNGATGGSTASHNCTYGGNCNLANNGFTRTGYTFAGWKKGNTGSALSVGTSIKNVTTSGTVIYYAQWNIITLNVSFNCNGGTGGGSQTFTYGVNGQKFSTTCSRVGYNLAGWSAASNATSASWSVASGVSNDWIIGNAPSKTIYAVWTPIKLAVTFNCNGGTGGGSQTFTYDVSGQKFSTTCSRVGYGMLGWSASSGATSASWSVASGVSNDWIVGNAPSKTIYAIWNKTDNTAPTCGTVTYSPALKKDSKNNIYWINTSRRVTVTCSDASGCATVTKDFTATAKTGTVQIKDGVGNTANCSVTPYVDVTLPVIKEIVYKKHNQCSANRGWGSFVKTTDPHSGISRIDGDTTPSKYSFDMMRYNPSKTAVGNTGEQNEIACEAGTQFPNNNTHYWNSLKVYDMAGNCTKLVEKRRLRATDSNFTTTKC